jgi:hypothetical protein
VSLQVLMITPSAGTKLYEGTFTDGMVFKKVGGREVLPHMYDGNYVVASNHKFPWLKQFNMMAGYASFYNPWRLIGMLLRKKTKVSHKAAGMQIVGMIGLFHTIRRTMTWAARLMFGKIDRLAEAPRPPLPMRRLAEVTAPPSPVTITIAASVRSQKSASSFSLPVAAG